MLEKFGAHSKFTAPQSKEPHTHEFRHPAAGAIWLKVNGAEKQSGDLADMIWNVAESIACLSGLVELAPGDLIMTGTPSGRGAVIAGDAIEVHVDGVGDLNVTIAQGIAGLSVITGDGRVSDPPVSDAEQTASSQPGDALGQTPDPQATGVATRSVMPRTPSARSGARLK